MSKHLLAALITLCVALPVAVNAAPKGRPGLWDITSTVQMAKMPDIPPEVLEMMKKRGMPGFGQPTKSQICVAANDTSADAASRMQAQHGVTCTPRIISETGTSAVTEVTCHGTMEGTGRSQISWRGDSHYDGTYSFKGTSHGQPQEMGTKYTGDWVKADCGSVKPFSAKDIPAHRPPPPH